MKSGAVRRFWSRRPSMALAKHTGDLTRGSITKGMLLYALPVMASALLQSLYHNADIMVVGKFAENGEDAVGAIGATGALFNLIVNILTGLAVGATAVVARHYGAGSKKGLSDSIHTSIAIGFFGGILVGTFGYFSAQFWLELMETDSDLLPPATLYLKIYFLALPFSMVYNFGAAVLRAIGDTRRPLYILMLSGLLNVALNLLFVIVFDMNVAGVAFATAISNGFSALLVILIMRKGEGYLQYQIRKTRIHIMEMKPMLAIGLPTALQSSMFSLSNVIIQSTLNSFGKAAASGVAIARNLCTFVYYSFNAFNTAALAYAGQNYGAKRFDRLSQIMKKGILLATACSMFVGALFVLCDDLLLSFYTDSAELIEWAKIYNTLVSGSYFLCGVQEVMVGFLRGVGESLRPTILSIFSICIYRLIWIYVALPPFRTAFGETAALWFLYLSYPISWIIMIVALLYMYRSKMKKLTIELSSPPPEIPAA